MTSNKWLNYVILLSETRFQIGTSNNRDGRRTLHYVFTGQGISMLAGVLAQSQGTYASIKMKENIEEICRKN